MTLLKSRLITLVAEHHPELRQDEAERAVNAVLETITAALERGDRVELRGFGAFSVRHRDARTGRNPRTGEKVEVPAKAAPFFRAGKELRQKVDASKAREHEDA